MSAAWLQLHTVLSLRVDAREAYRLMHNYRDEELRKRAEQSGVVEDYPGQLAMLTGLVATLNAVAEHGDFEDVKKLLAEYATDDGQARKQSTPSKIGEKSSPAGADATSVFFQVGHTYVDDEYDWKFRVDAITTHPEDGERTALGWRFFKGQWEEMAYGEDDWEIHQLVGHTDVTKTGEGQ
ncbi:hypothetical protein [Streptomyces sp. NPDC001139]